jgi:hypothetical protein
MAVASAPASTPVTPRRTTATKQPQVKYAQKPKVKAKARKSNRPDNVRRDAAWQDNTWHDNVWRD